MRTSDETPARGLAPYAVIRIAALDVGWLHRLEATAARTAPEVECAEARVREVGGRLGELLAQLVPREADRARRRKLLEIRRDVHNANRRLLYAGAGRLATDERDDEAVRALLEEWQAALRASCAAIGAGDAAVEHDDERLANEIATMWADPRFKRAVLFSSPNVHERLDRELDSGATFSAWAIPAAVAYAYRMVTKPTPRSSFALVAVGAPIDVEVRPAAVGHSSSVPCCDSYTLEPAVAEALVDAISADPDARYSLKLVLNRTLDVSEDVCFITSPRGSEERITWLERAPAIDALISAFPPGSAQSLDDAVSEPLVRGAAAAGLIQPEPSFEPYSTFPLPDWNGSGNGASPLPPSWSAYLRRLREKLAALADDDVADQAHALRSIQSAVPTAESSARMTPVHHGVYVREPLALGCEALARFEPTFVTLNALATLFESQRTARLRMHELWRRLGREGESIVRFFAKYSESTGADGGSSAPSHEAVTVRDVFLDYVDAAAASSDVAAELSLESLTPFAETARALVPSDTPLSASYQFQLCRTENDVVAVLNDVGPGYGSAFAHVASDDDSIPARAWLATALRRSLTRIDADYVAVDGLFGFSGQIHAHVTPKKLVYPGALHPTRVAPTPWSDVVVVSDQGTGLPVLRSRRSGRRLIPIKLGTLAPHLLPPFFRFVLSFGPPQAIGLPILPMLERRARRAAPDAIRHYARLSCDGVVLLRETWSIPSRSLIHRERSERTFSFGRRLERWARDLGLPRQTFVTPISIGRLTSRDLEQQPSRRLRRPFYVDWSDFNTHRLVERYVPSDGDVSFVVSEMLPRPAQIHSHVGFDHHVAEYVVEAYG